MRQPPWMTEQPHSSVPTYGRNSRALVQCTRCLVTSTADLRNGRILRVDTPYDVIPSVGVRHHDCGGKFKAYDLREHHT